MYRRFQVNPVLARERLYSRAFAQHRHSSHIHAPISTHGNSRDRPEVGLNSQTTSGYPGPVVNSLGLGPNQPVSQVLCMRSEWSLASPRCAVQQG